MLGASIERDRDFEDLLRHHWGFAEVEGSDSASLLFGCLHPFEVSTILEDMRGKFAMVRT